VFFSIYDYELFSTGDRRLALDAIIISDSGVDSVSGTNPLRLNLDGRIAYIQVVLNYLRNEGKVVPPVEGDNTFNWAAAPKLNGIYLLNYLTKNNFEVELINSYFQEKDQFRRLLQKNPRAILISTTYIHKKQSLYSLVRDIRQLAPDAFIVVGGPLVYLSYFMLQRSRDVNYDTESAKADYLFLDTDQEPDVNLYIVSLGGEKILCAALDRILKNKKVEDLPNTASFQADTYRFSPRIDDFAEAEDYYIDWEALPEAVFESGTIPMQASNGCPYDCAFCNFTKDHRFSFIKPLDQLVVEMKAVMNRGARYVWFVDDNFRLGKGDLNAVCRRFVEENIQVHWMTFVRASTLQDVDVKLLRQAGCCEVQLGLESADAQMLRYMQKKADPVLYHEVLDKLLAGGINCSCYFICGFPGETPETVRRTREFIKQHEYPDFEGSLRWSIYPFILTPLSPIYQPGMRKQFDLTGYLHQWEHRTMNAEQAKVHIIETFLELNDSGPIYRGDNQDFLRNLGPKRTKEFEAARHRLSKTALKRHLKKRDIIQTFEQVLQD
jgi:radical SAM superfamily enzyme YgiQ (UPF0313 family)